VIPHTCGNSSNTVVQAYLYAAAKMQGGPVGLGTDMNGFAGLPGPRGGAGKCPGGGSSGAVAGVQYPFIAAATGRQMNASVVGQKTYRLDVDGLAHVGMLPDLIADFQAMGLTQADLEPLLNSAEGYVKVWERCVARHRAGTARVVCRGQDGHIHEIALGGNGWKHWDMTTGTGTPAAAGDPMGYQG
jgi:hypothetical protein